eukprot:Awhi_evm1s985
MFDKKCGNKVKPTRNAKLQSGFLGGFLNINKKGSENRNTFPNMSSEESVASSGGSTSSLDDFQYNNTKTKGKKKKSSKLGMLLAISQTKKQQQIQQQMKKDEPNSPFVLDDVDYISIESDHTNVVVPRITTPLQEERDYVITFDDVDYIVDTYSREDYDRRLPPKDTMMTYNEIVSELNSFKRDEMEVHPDSIQNTLLHKTVGFS